MRVSLVREYIWIRLRTQQYPDPHGYVARNSLSLLPVAGSVARESGEQRRRRPIGTWPPQRAEGRVSVRAAQWRGEKTRGRGGLYNSYTRCAAATSDARVYSRTLASPIYRALFHIYVVVTVPSEAIGRRWRATKCKPRKTLYAITTGSTTQNTRRKTSNYFRTIPTTKITLFS